MSMSVFSSSFISNSYQIGQGTALKLLSDTTLAAPANSISSGTFTAYSYLKVMLVYPAPSGGIHLIHFDNDALGHYYWRYSEDGGADAASAGLDNDIQPEVTANNDPGAVFMDISNIGGTASVTGVSSKVTHRSEFQGYYNTAAVTRIDFLRSGAETYDTGSRLIVMGL